MSPIPAWMGRNSSLSMARSVLLPALRHLSLLSLFFPLQPTGLSPNLILASLAVSPVQISQVLAWQMLFPQLSSEESRGSRGQHSWRGQLPLLLAAVLEGVECASGPAPLFLRMGPRRVIGCFSIFSAPQLPGTGGDKGEVL